MPDFYPNRLRHWAEAVERGSRAPASRDQDVLLGMADAWDADIAALQEMTEAANEEGVRASKAEAEVRELRAALEQARALLAELAGCGYECQAGPLENNAAYRELAALLPPAAKGGAA